jgi:signal transduction histidine kinase
MRVIEFLRRRPLETAWVAFAEVNVLAMMLWPRWETIPFHLIWFTLTLLYGFRVWPLRPTAVVLGSICVVTGVLIADDAMHGTQVWGELFEVPLMSGMFLAMVWHARRRQDAMRALATEADERAALLARQESFLHDVSHELRTPVTIARGHLEVLARENGRAPAEVTVALDELDRMQRIVERLLLLAKADNADWSVTDDVDPDAFLEDVLMRWSETAPRVWRLGELAGGRLSADPEALRIALDALIENALNHTVETDAIEVSSEARDDGLAIAVADEGPGIASGAVERIFERFGRADPARSRAHGGVGLGLAIVDAIARSHGGRCTVTTSSKGTTFRLHLPEFRASAPPAPLAVTPRSGVGLVDAGGGVSP